MKLFLVIVILAVAIFFAVQYFNNTLSPHSDVCPNGTTYARSALGGGWVATDPSDPSGTCVANDQIGAAGQQ